MFNLISCLGLIDLTYDVSLNVSGSFRGYKINENSAEDNFFKIFPHK